MISWTKLAFGKKTWGDKLRYEFHAGPSRPVIVWNITPSCNLNCVHCYLDASFARSETVLSEAATRDIICDLADFGVPAILFSGGEPLLRKDIFDLARLAADKGLRAILSTNGTLITPSVARQIKRAGFRYVGISIDGSPGTHDRLRGKSGSHAKAVQGIRNCINAGIKTGVRFTLMKENFEDLNRVFSLVSREGIGRVCIYLLVYSGRAKRRIGDDLTFSQKRIALELIWKGMEDFHKKVLDVEILTVDNSADGIWIYNKLKSIDSGRAERALEMLEANGGNRSGEALACVDHLGNVYADQFLRDHPLGSLRKKRFSNIWLGQDSALLRGLRNRREFIKGRCGKCRFFALCNGNMRARAEAAYGDIWAEDPACYLSDEEIYGKGEPAPCFLGDDSRLQSKMPAL